MKRVATEGHHYSRIAAFKNYLQLLLKRLALHWSHISAGFGFSVVDS
jgi:hypothetical protein